MSGIGALLPRDFLERQPKRWQKSQRKRRVLGTLRKLKAKREKVAQRTIEQAERVAGIRPQGHERQSKGGKLKEAVPSVAAPAAPPSCCTPFGGRRRGLWACRPRGGERRRR